MSIEHVIVELRMMGIYIGLDCNGGAMGLSLEWRLGELADCEAGEKPGQLIFSA
jgi:hypothetical protein